ncbi:sodium:proton exchanger [Nakamurella sp. YIM 132087]|uniref:Sodium:proton exchanger n=1 Tax=Nakamurella alba TaxID=2665158 RepID=A0A7K1FM92_9ACTN|nr:sodium:proton exchanger [Nakamurella alba]MTD15226.1 sodium:proton exchanger [Nakamurella alba]
MTSPSIGRAHAARLTRSLGICAVLIAPAVTLRVGGIETSPLVQLLVYGAAVVAASFLLAWAAEAAQKDISGGLAIAVLALIAVLPEYAVDLFYAYRAGSDPEYVQYAAANMTGSNRLLLGLGWPVVVLVALAAAKRLHKGSTRALHLEPGNRLELGFLMVAGVVAFLMPITGQIHIGFGLAVLAWFGYYLYRLTRGEVEEPHLVGTSAALGALSRIRRRIVLPGLFVVAAAVILLCAEPFATSLVDTGTQLGVDRFLLVQWLAPLSSEAPEFIIAIIFASRGNGAAAIATLISSKVNQWTLLVGSLPIAHLLGGGGSSLVLDSRQVEEMLLTSVQTMMGVALILALRFTRASAWTLLGLFAVQFAVTGTTGRLILSGVYALIAVAALVHHRRHVVPTFLAPFRPLPADAPEERVPQVAAR